ncbi:MAG TPA: tetratricopeptide repeat protein [Isosphaeraceae bacterium]|jgi:tetratricopeptide (TPR) repeat protein|nr:tetratricopeptide repeat protein [Isosphaeraceae bacterium]
MTRMTHDRIVRKLLSAEGYLEIDLPQRALEILQSRSDWATMQFEASFLTGEALRSLERYREALKPLEVAAGLKPGDPDVAIALGWCYKRTHRLAQAIDALGRALRENPQHPLLHYNQACYWSLANNPAKAIDALAVALDLDPKLRSWIPAESDFDSIRGHPEFERLVVGPAPLA